eukprot:4197286-Prorocentrum_lima.AAC.1
MQIMGSRRSMRCLRRCRSINPTTLLMPGIHWRHVSTQKNDVRARASLQQASALVAFPGTSY